MTPDARAELIEKLYAIGGCNDPVCIPCRECDAVASEAADALEADAKEIEGLVADRDEWKQQHENLLAVKAEDNRNLSARIKKVEADREQYGQQFLDQQERTRIAEAERARP